MISINLSNIAILNVKGPDYCCIISSKSKSHLPEKGASFETPLKMIKNTFYFIFKAPFVLKIFKFLS